MRFGVRDRVTYFDGMIHHVSDVGTVLAVDLSDPMHGYLIRWDNGLSDACECDSHPMGTAKPDCKGEWFGPQDLRPVTE